MNVYKVRIGVGAWGRGIGPPAGMTKDNAIIHVMKRYRNDICYPISEIPISDLYRIDIAD